MIQRFQEVVWGGLRVTMRHWRVLAPLYIVGLVLGLIQTWPLLGVAAGGALSNPFLDRLAGGGLDVALDLLLSAPGTVSATAGLWVAGALVFSLLYGAAYNFFGGGILSVYLGGAAGSFWAACRRTFWTFTGLGLLLVALALVIVVIGAAADAAIGQRAALIVALILLQLANMIGEYTRALAVARDRRNPFMLIGLAVRFCAHHPAGTLALALIGVLLHLALLLVYRVVAGSLGGSPLNVVWQQFVVIGWLWVKLLRLSWAAAYVRTEDTAPMSVGDLQPVV